MAGRRKKFTHPRLMKIDPDYVPCAAIEDDEICVNGVFRFNISKMLADMASGILTAVPLQIDIRKWYQEHYHDSVNEEHLPTVDPSHPILVAEINEGNNNIIDGNHRFEKARRSGQEWIGAWQVSGEQLIPYFVTKNGYESFISYWNGKLQDHESDRKKKELRDSLNIGQQTCT